MDKVYDFFKDLKERISSPFFSSFIISWLAFNWMFITTIFKYDVSGFTIFYYNVYIDYANSLLSTWKSFWLPLISAFSYSLFYPFLRNGIEIADVWFKKWGTNSKIKVAKGSKISVEKYIKLREIYELRTKTLEDVLEKESKIIERNEQLVNELNELKQENNDFHASINEKKKEINDLNNKMILLQASLDSEKIKLSKYQDEEEIHENKNNVEFLNGSWFVSLKNPLYKEEIFNVKIHNRIVYKISSEEIAKEWFTITSYKLNEITKNIEIQTNIKYDDIYFNLTFKYNEDLTILIGVDNINETNKYSFARIEE
ncbi:hypothetical protein [Sediminibacterium sp.]|uniref:hypothetical protein n=1 Tax=Sediminibacterium sp. TaxID=1917865 RepID=UPI0027351B25|nr:hypothetical protein [Sediminibacterium sp.]MDP3394996.1 hypothetical protein [Sediminibacterium sp.]MDP3565622.1 hypothetical protein [Sediminibacterium sp.]